ncbi:hypothetical protein L3Q82_000476 [Scortum barcoo]|uniref:Uncharacterized protein n=1 Tax=Scortum barcoo TaxID=214431 RepID=A0ACB8WEQ2_9TELE|nr:hypothetical protein L3Q82_000476 [Scortum barcoo]
MDDMDPADASTIRSALSSQGNKILQHEEQLHAITISVKELSERQMELHSSVASQIDHLARQLQRVISQLEKTAAPRPASPPPAPSASASSSPPPVLRLRGGVVCQHSKVFSQTLTSMFDHKSPAREASRALLGLSQKGRRVIDYAIEFCTLAADSGWNAAAINDAFVNGLSEDIKDQLAPRELPPHFEDLVDIAVRIDSRLLEREKERRRIGKRTAKIQGAPWGAREFRRPTRPPVRATMLQASSTGGEEPMQLDRTRLGPEERQRRLKEGACFYCGQQDHRVASCPTTVEDADNNGLQEAFYFRKKIHRNKSSECHHVGCQLSAHRRAASVLHLSGCVH